MGQTCSRNASPVFEEFCSYMNKEAEYEDNISTLKKLKKESKKEAKFSTEVLEVLKESKESFIFPHRKLFAVGKKYYPEQFNDESEISNEKVEDFQIDSLGLEFSWQRELSKIVEECCKKSKTLSGAFKYYQDNYKDKSRKERMAHALNNLGWEPSEYVLGLWYRDSF